MDVNWNLAISRVLEDASQSKSESVHTADYVNPAYIEESGRFLQRILYVRGVPLCAASACVFHFPCMCGSRRDMVSAYLYAVCVYVAGGSGQ